MTKEEKWEKLQRRWKKCKQCPELSSQRHSVVPGEGALDSKLLVIGEAPGALEDKRGRPFIGDSGILLRRTLIELDLGHCFITNIVACHPPHNRDPDEEEVLNCLNRVQAIVHLLQPAIILMVGRVCYQTLHHATESISTMRGTPMKYEYRWKGKWHSCPSIAIWHPAYILRNRSLLEEWKRDLRSVERYL